MQVLVSVGKNCRPNSPKPDRAWMQAKPISGLPEFGDALSALLRAGLLQRKSRHRVKPSPDGYALIYQWKAYRRDLKLRPVLYDRCIWDQPIELQLKQAA